MEVPSGPLPSVCSILGEDMISGRWGPGQDYPLHPRLGLLQDHTRTKRWGKCVVEHTSRRSEYKQKKNVCDRWKSCGLKGGGLSRGRAEDRGDESEFECSDGMSAGGSRAFWHGWIACETGEASTRWLVSKRTKQRKGGSPATVVGKSFQVCRGACVSLDGADDLCHIQKKAGPIN